MGSTVELQAKQIEKINSRHRGEIQQIKMTQSSSQNIALHSEIRNKSAKISDLNEEISGLKTQLQSLQSDANDFQAEWDEMHNQTIQAKGTVHQLTVELQNARMDRQILTNRFNRAIGSLRVINDGLAIENEDLEAQKSRLMVKLDESNSLVEYLRRMVGESSRDNQNLKSQSREIQGKLDEANSMVAHLESTTSEQQMEIVELDSLLTQSEDLLRTCTNGGALNELASTEMVAVATAEANQVLTVGDIGLLTLGDESTGIAISQEGRPLGNIYVNQNKYVRTLLESPSEFRVRCRFLNKRSGRKWSVRVSIECYSEKTEDDLMNLVTEDTENGFLRLQFNN